MGKCHLNSWTSNVLMIFVTWVTWMLGLLNLVKATLSVINRSELLNQHDTLFFVLSSLTAFVITAIISYQIIKKRIKSQKAAVSEGDYSTEKL